MEETIKQNIKQMIKNVLLKVLCAAMVVLSFAQCGNGESKSVNAPKFSNDSNSLSIVYVRQDSLLSKYELYQYLSKENLKKEENIRVTLGEKQRDFEKDAMEFQRKIENNAFATRERAEEEQARILKKQENLQALSDKLTTELAIETQKNMKVLADSVNNVLNEVRKEFGYQYILSDPLCADESLDITELVVERLNQRYQKPAEE